MAQVYQDQQIAHAARPATNRGTSVSMPLCARIKSLHFVATPLFCCVRNQYTIDSGVDLMSSEAERTQTN